MKRAMSFLSVVVLMLAGLSFSGCSTHDSNMPAADRGATAGGNGAFGESPARPGSYAGDQYNTPTTQPAASH